MTATMTATENGVTTWVLDGAHTQVGFEVHHMMFARVRGRFTEVEGTVRIAEQGSDVESGASVVIRAASIDTGQSQRDEHLRSGDFFDVETFPELTFEGVEVERDGTRITLAGDLRIRDITRRVELEVEELGSGIDPWGNQRIGFTATTVIDRRDYGLTWNQALETGGILVGNEVRIVIEVQATRSEP